MPDDEQNQQDWKRFQRLKPRKGTFRRHFRKIETSTLRHAHTFIIRRWANVLEVRRHALGWMLLIFLLIGCMSWQSVAFASLYTTQIAGSDTAYSEGVVGNLDTLNPIFATSLPERSAANLLFAGLLRYDIHNNLTGDLAETWHYDDGGKRIIVVLRPDLKWQDNAPITSKDVVYTINAIKNTDSRSPLFNTWQNVTAQAIDNRTVAFNLPTTYAPFINALTVGVLPQHLLGTISPVELRNAPFNRSPIGSGPFIFHDLKSIGANNAHIVLSVTANPEYHLGKPKLSKFYLHAFDTMDQLSRSYQTDEINAAANLDVQTIHTLPANKRSTVTDSPLYNGTYAFFRMDNPILADATVRQALRLATDRNDIINRLDGHVLPLNGPLLPAQLSTATPLPRQPVFNRQAAEQLLDQAGWVKGANGKRAKGNQNLQLTLATSQSGDFPTVVNAIAQQWNAIGVTVQIQLVPPTDIQQSLLLPRAYDVLVYELAIGRDPDVYAYWHSSQANPAGLNLSDYKSGIVDDALDSARSRLEAPLRDAKYHAFYAQWVSDAPAIALFQPTLHYAANPYTSTLKGRSIVDATDRFSQVRYWSASKVTGYTTP